MREWMNEYIGGLEISLVTGYGRHCSKQELHELVAPFLVLFCFAASLAQYV